MTFWQLLLRVAPAKPVTGLIALWWHLARRRVRARNILRTAAARMSFAYRYWIEEVESRSEPPVDSGVGFPITILLLRGAGADQGGLKRTIESVLAQSQGAWQLAGEHLPAELVASDHRLSPVDGSGACDIELVRRVLGTLTPEFILPLRVGDILPTWALARFSECLAAKRATDLIYGDHDYLDGAGERSSPWFKPDWNEEMFLAQDFVSRSCLFRASAALAQLSNVPAPQSLFELLIKLTHGKRDRVAHVPHITLHAAAARAPELDAASRAKAVERQLGDVGVSASAAAHNSVKLHWPLPDPLPLVSIIIPTKDKLELLEPCVRTVLQNTTYPSFEVLIVDNDSQEERTLRYLKQLAEDPRVRVLPRPIAFNYSALNNFAAEQAKGSFLCLLNNDTDVIAPEWLTELMRYAVRSDVGAVGAKLLYDDGTIQHAGVVVGMGDAAGHLHRFEPNDSEGYFAMPHVTQEVTAVTGACLLVAKDKYIEVGGLDEERLAVAYNDVDFCLKLRLAGYRNIYVPYAVLIHHESKSRAKDHAPSQIARYSKELSLFQERWGTSNFHDPLFNPNFDRSSETMLVRLTKCPAKQGISCS